MSEGRTVLLADDDRSIRTVLSQALGRVGLRVRATGSASSLWQMVDSGEGDIVVTDVHMPDGDALDLLPAIKRRRPELPIIVMSAQNTVLTAIRATEAGAFEYLPKPFDLNVLIQQVRKGLAPSEPVPASRQRGTGPVEENLPLVGRSAAMQDVYRVIARLMTTDLTVLITGESGTGKELVARALHNFGRRSKGPFIALNMAAIPRTMIEAELFGQRPTGTGNASETAPGKFSSAEGGTLFLDEVGDMPAEAQTRLLRVLEDGEFSAANGQVMRRVDVRIVAATHQDLRQLIADGRFREDLFYRLNVVPLRLPPLRERMEDLPDLARHFLRRAESEGLPRKIFTKPALDRLARHDWPGNVRELENMIRRLAALCPEDQIGLQSVAAELDLQDKRSAPSTSAAPNETLSSAVEAHLGRYFALHDDGLPPPGLYDRVLREIELPLIALTLAATRGNQVKASELLGINRNTLRKKIRDLDIRVTRGKKLM